MSGRKIGIVVGGSIAAYKACEVVSRLVQRGHAVRVVLTEGGGRFVGAATLEGLSGHPVLTDLFAAGAALEHIDFSRWADLILVCPASAGLLNRLAAGLADDLAGALFLARNPAQPWLVAPAMNPRMWSHPATHGAVGRLQEWGLRFVPVAAGRTACDEYGEGRLADPADIVAAVETAAGVAGPEPVRRRRVLITSGGTSEPIDAVRVITNTSTGHTGAVIARHFAARGHDVTLLRARGAESAGLAGERTFFTFDDLARELEGTLRAEEFDAVIHCAAVADFRVQQILISRDVRGGDGVPALASKLDSEAPPTLVLGQNRKLINELRQMSGRPGLCVIAFKLGVGAAEAPAAVRRLQQASGADLVVYNDLEARTDADAFPSELFLPDGTRWAHAATRPQLAAKLEEFILSTSHAALP